MSNNRIDEIWAKLLEVAQTQGEHGAILKANTKDLQYHIKRTDILEDKVEKSLVPLKVLQWSAASLGVVGTVVGVITAIKQLL